MAGTPSVEKRNAPQGAFPLKSEMVAVKHNERDIPTTRLYYVTSLDGFPPKYKYMPYHGNYYKKNRKRILANQAEYNRKHAKEIAEYRQRYYKKYHYGMDYSDFLAMLKSQGNACRICKVVFDEMTTPHVDHNHTTGKVQSLLCRRCNLGLGNFKESPELLVRAAEYLKYHG